VDPLPSKALAREVKRLNSLAGGCVDFMHRLSALGIEGPQLTTGSQNAEVCDRERMSV
jgi:hypothetical protein